MIKRDPLRKLWIRSAAALPAGVGSFVFLAGLVSLVGWLQGIPTLASWVHGGAVMKADGAITFMILGGALVLRATPGYPRSGVHIAGLVMVVGAFAFGALTVVEYLVKINFGIDELVIADVAGRAAGVAHPGRIAPLTAVAFVLLPCALLAVERPRTFRLGLGITLLVGVVATLNVVQYLFGGASPTAVGPYTQMAVSTSALIGLLAIGVLARIPGGAGMAFLGISGPVWSHFRPLLIAAVLLPILLGLLRKAGEDAGFYDAAYGTSLYATSLVGLFFGAILLSGRAEARRRQTQSGLERVFELSPDLVVVIQPNGHFSTVSPSWERTLGWSTHELTSRPFLSFVHPDDVERTAEEFRREMRAGHTSLQFRNRYRATDGTYRWLEWSAGLDVRTGLVYGIARDMTASIEHATALADANLRLEVQVDQLARSNQALGEFAVVASHDLQEPLRKIQAFGDRLATRSAAALDEESLDYLARMRSSAGRMQRLIVDLLAYSQLLTDREDRDRVDLGRLVRLVLVDLETELDSSGATVEVAILPTIDADRSQMTVLFQNLIGNALKFQRPGVPPEIEVGVRLSDDGRLWEIRVVDQGIGFDSRFGDRIFVPFQRLHRRAEYAGTGMGLAMCRRIVERHGGTITAMGTPGEGSVFTVALPVAGEIGSQALEKVAA